MNGRWEKTYERMNEYTLPLIGNAIPFSDSASLEEIFRISFCLFSPLLVLREPPRRDLREPALLPTWPPCLKTPPFIAGIFLQNACSFCCHWLAVLGVEGRHVYGLYSSPRLEAEPLLYVKAMSPPGFKLPGVKVSAFPLMKSI